MTRLMELLEKVIGRLEEDNPYGLILKGGTALSVFHCRGHRESEDLDFDVPAEHLDDHEAIVEHLKGILEDLVEEGSLTGFTVDKSGFAHTDRYHMTLTLVTHRKLRTKVDLNFIQDTPELVMKGRLGFYTAERMLVTKLMTFAGRGELKDLYDIAHLLRTVKASSFRERGKVAELTGSVLDSIDEKDLTSSYSRAFRNIDLRFKDLKERDVAPFVKRVQRDLRRFKNELLK